MKESEINRDEYDYRGQHIKTCLDCGNDTRVYTQADTSPEYYTEIAVICDCGEVINFTLPVN